MDKALRILFIVDEVAAAERVEAQLRAAGLEFTGLRVDAEEPFLRALAEFRPHVVLSDYSLRQFAGRTALRLSQERDPLLPFVILTDASNEEIAVECMKAGAADYVIRERDKRLPFAIRDAIELRRSRMAKAEAERALALSIERFELASRATNDALWDLNLQTGALYISPRFAALVGCADGDIPTTRAQVQELMHPDDRERAITLAEECMNGTKPRFETEYRLRAAGGCYRWFRARGALVCDDAGHRLRFSGSIADVHDRKLAEQQLVHDAFHDPLTGLPNRALFFDRLDSAVKRAQRERNLWFTVMVLDLDRFKIINDSLGHIAGDELLVKVAARLTTCIRQVDTLARLGGDEFAILLEGAQDEGTALHIAERIVKEFSIPISVRGHDIVATTSIGIAFGSKDHTRGEDIVRDADIALYRAKGSGRSRFEIFDPKMHEHAMRSLQIEHELRGAMARGELMLYFHPIVRVAGESIVSFEALVRWNNPTRGLLSPAQFIPIAEDTGQVVGIGEWVIREACAALRRFHEHAPPGSEPIAMNVNLSTKHFYHSGIVDFIRGVVRDHGLDPSHLPLEIPERAIMHHPELASEVLTRFADAGFRMHLDEFATGHSSLKYLLEYPIHSIKIDRSFMKRIPADARSLALMESVFLLASKLGLGFTAEGVETEEQLQAIRAMKCEHVQGFLFSRPMTEADALALWKAGKKW